MINYLTRINLGTILLLPILIFIFLYLSENIVFVSNYYETSDVVDLGMWGTFEMSKNINRIITGLIILINALLISTVFNKQNLHEHSTLIPGITYILFLSVTHSFYSFNGDLILQTFMILSLFPILKYDFNEINLRIPFNIGFLLGVGSTFFPIFLLFFPLIFLVDIILRSFNYRYMMFYISGWLTPQIYLISYYYLTGSPFENLLDFWDRLYFLNSLDFAIFIDALILLLAFIITLPVGKIITNTVGLKAGKQIQIISMSGVMAMIVVLTLLFVYGIASSFHLIVPSIAILLSGAILKSSNKSIYHSFLIVLFVYSFIKFFFN